MAAVVVLDIGGSGVRAARVQDGEIVRRARLGLIPGTVPSQAAETLRAALGSLVPSPTDGALGVAFPGFLDDAGRVLPGIYLPGFVGMDFVDVLGPLMTGRPIAVVPDVAAASLAEAAATGFAGRLLCVCLGTGANAALVADGVVVDLAAGCLGDAGQSWSTLTVLSALAGDEDVSRRCARVGRWPVTAPRSASSTRPLFAKRHERWTRGPPSWSTVPAGHWDAP